MRLGRLRRRLASGKEPCANHRCTVRPDRPIREPMSAVVTPGHEVQALAHIDTVFEHGEHGEPGSREESEQDAFLTPARLPSLLAGALLAWFLLARHVAFRPGSELTASGHSLLNSSPNASGLPPQLPVGHLS